MRFSGRILEQASMFRNFNILPFQYLAKRLSRHRANLNAEWRPRPNVMMPGLAGRRRSSSIALTYDSLLQEQR
jgi:hypothetical protein